MVVLWHTSVDAEQPARLVDAGLTCIAAGAVDTMHKSYFATHLVGSGEWFMLEVIIFWDAASAQATFRTPCAEQLPPLADHFGRVLSAAMRASFR